MQTMKNSPWKVCYVTYSYIRGLHELANTHPQHTQIRHTHRMPYIKIRNKYVRTVLQYIHADCFLGRFIVLQCTLSYPLPMCALRHNNLIHGYFLLSTGSCFTIMSYSGKCFFCSHALARFIVLKWKMGQLSNSAFLFLNKELFPSLHTQQWRLHRRHYFGLFLFLVNVLVCTTCCRQ